MGIFKTYQSYGDSGERRLVPNEAINLSTPQEPVMEQTPVVDRDPPTIKRGRPPKRVYPNKFCTVCHKNFSPTSPHQTKCPDCKDKKSPAELKAGVPDNPCLTTNIDEILQSSTMLEESRRILGILPDARQVNITFDDLILTVSRRDQ